MRYDDVVLGRRSIRHTHAFAIPRFFAEKRSLAMFSAKPIYCAFDALVGTRVPATVAKLVFDGNLRSFRAFSLALAVPNGAWLAERH